jgi:oxygen-independent coproporphyrinogen-3 oxidase
MPLSVYIHVPFCTHRCAYCDFNTYAGQERLIPAYVDALCREIAYVGEGAHADPGVHTIFLGGGTPSLLLPGQVRLVLDRIRATFQVAEGAEITLEANPGTVSEASLRELRSAGINRISFGVQSANGEELRMLERMHDFGDVLDAMSAARRAGFVNLNADLIYGLPGQSLPVWQTTVRRVLQLDTQHISAYALTLEHGTPFGHWANRGLLEMPDPDLAADMYEWLCDEMTAAGYLQYEISNWARPGSECLHNLQYWRTAPYLGLGAGAHGYAGGRRYANVLSVGSYVDRLTANPDTRPDYPCSTAAATQHVQTVEDDMGECMMMGLRLTREGVSPGRFRARFGRDLMEKYGPEIAELVRSGLLEWAESAGPPDAGGAGYAGGVIRLTKRGRLLGNRVFSEFVESPSAG